MSDYSNQPSNGPLLIPVLLITTLLWDTLSHDNFPLVWEQNNKKKASEKTNALNKICYYETMRVVQYAKSYDITKTITMSNQRQSLSHLRRQIPSKCSSPVLLLEAIYLVRVPTLMHPPWVYPDFHAIS